MGLLGPDPTLPGFGPFGTCGHHVFDPGHPAYRRIVELARARRRYRVLRAGRMYVRPTAAPGGAFRPDARPGELLAWSRLLDGVEALCVVNSHGRKPRGAEVVVDQRLSPPGSWLSVVLNTAAAGGAPGPLAPGERVPVQQRPGGPAFVALPDVGPSEVVVLVNRP
jgi:hypothetical protein